MRIFSRIFHRVSNTIYELQARLGSIKQKVAYETPFVCQFAIPQHAELSLTKKLAPKDDPHWELSGAASPERYAQWAFTMCGMASLAMGLGYFKGTTHKPAELAEDALKHGVYVDEGEDISAMKYREFASWVGKYGLRAEVFSRLSIRGIQYALSRGKLVIVSVNPNIRGYDTAPANQKGGHLVLVVGYDKNQGTISINNPSGFTSTNTQLGHSLPVGEFGKYYAERGIVLSA